MSTTGRINTTTEQYEYFFSHFDCGLDCSRREWRQYL
jgi:hypothetical protein